jgi:cytochrome c
MRRELKVSLTAALSLLLATPTLSQPRTEPQPVAKVLPQNAITPNAAGNTGVQAFRQCSACHTLKAGQRNTLGPNLAQFFGKRAGTANATFRYSSAFTRSTLIWDEETLDRFLTSPNRTIPGTSMAFSGIAQPTTRAALIAYLKQETK